MNSGRQTKDEIFRKIKVITNDIEHLMLSNDLNNSITKIKDAIKREVLHQSTVARN